MRLIDADALLELLNKDPIYKAFVEPYGMSLVIESRPTIEAEPKHGRWIDNKVAFHRVCSECGAVIKQDISLVYLLECMEKVGHLNYCPNCGARMDEVEE